MTLRSNGVSPLTSIGLGLALGYTAVVGKVDTVPDGENSPPPGSAAIID